MGSKRMHIGCSWPVCSLTCSWRAAISCGRVGRSRGPEATRARARCEPQNASVAAKTTTQNTAIQRKMTRRKAKAIVYAELP